MEILVIDGQGGGLGRQLVAAVQQAVPEARITAVGTNSQATAAMRKAGAHRTATGENAVVVACRKADVIVGPIGMVIADALLGDHPGHGPGCGPKPCPAAAAAGEPLRQPGGRRGGQLGGPSGAVRRRYAAAAG